jgi:predicted nucleotidyltransferase
MPALKRTFKADARVLGVFLFGSQADATATLRSDIDLAVLFDCDLALADELKFEVAVSDALGTDEVDVVNLNHANLLLRFRAISGKLLYQREETRVSDFVERTIIEYRDFEPRAQAALRDYLAAL